MKTKHVSVPHTVDAVQLTPDLIVTILKEQANGCSLMGRTIKMSSSNDFQEDTPRLLIQYPNGRTARVITGDYLLLRHSLMVIMPRLLLESMYVLPEEIPDDADMTYQDIQDAVKDLGRFKNLTSVSFKFEEKGFWPMKFVEMKIHSR